MWRFIAVAIVWALLAISPELDGFPPPLLSVAFFALSLKCPTDKIPGHKSPFYSPYPILFSVFKF